MNEIEKLNMIAEWQEQHKQLIEDLDNSKKRIAELEEAKANLEYLLEGRDNEIDELKKENKVLAQNLEDTEICENGWKNRVKELEAQIEKMKCCGNCKNKGDYKEPYRYGTGWCNICRRHKVAKGNFDKWEIKEK